MTGFLVLGFFILNGYGYLMLHSDALSNTLSWKRILAAVKKSKRSLPSGSSVIILGDSIGEQLFPRETVPSSLISNGAVLAVGHYILANNAIKRNKNLKYIVLVSAPWVLGHQFEWELTYNSFMKPFYTFENLPYISKQLFEKINKRKMTHWVIFPFVKTAPCFSDIDLTGTRKKRRDILSDTAIEYLKKLKNLCSENNIEFIVLSPPIREEWRRRTNHWEKMKIQVTQNGLDDNFREYFKRLIYLDDSCFRDHVHMRARYINVKENRAGIIARILPQQVRVSLYPPK